MKISEKEKIEIDFWKESKTESPESFTIENVINKMSDCAVFYDILSRHRSTFEKAQSILELGGGQGWASCVVKKKHNKYTIASDISEYAVASIKYWEDTFKVKIDETFACRSYEIPLQDESVDLVFCFAAAHHFVEQEKSLTEIKRVLRKNGVCIFMYEPTCTRMLYPLAYKRVNKKRPEVPEDLLIYKEIRTFAESIGLKTTVEFYPSLEKRRPVETLYYYVLNKVSFLQKILPCTANYIFEKM